MTKSLPAHKKIAYRRILTENNIKVWPLWNLYEKELSPKKIWRWAGFNNFYDFNTIDNILSYRDRRLLRDVGYFVKDDVLCPLYRVQIIGVSLQFGSNSFYLKFLNETRPRKPARRRSLSLATQQKSFLRFSWFARAGFLFLKGKENFFAGFCSERAGRRAGFLGLVSFRNFG